MNIPAVRGLTIQNNYYQAEARGGIDLRRLANDHESSMNALTLGEQKRLDAMIKAYQPELSKIGTNKIIEQLRQTLIARYQANPAKIILYDGRECVLPVSYHDKIRLDFLKVEDYQHHFEAYYQNKDHTALRYISKPNYWMSLHADHVNIDPITYLRWSTFEEYQPLIAMLFLAAFDAKQPAIDGYTLEGRIDHFVDELAHLGRAHNWDETRIKVNSAGEPMVDKYGEVIEEEVDDLEGDKPSCYSGVKRRLFQSVVGHALMDILTQDIIQQELSSFVHHYFSSRVNASNRNQLKMAMDTLTNEIDIDYAKVVTPLKELDLSQKDEDQFIKYLTKKYGRQFTDDLKFSIFIKETFSLSSGPIDASINSHFSKLYTLANLEHLLVLPVEEKRKRSGEDELSEDMDERDKKRVKKTGFFSPVQSSSQPQEKDDDAMDIDQPNKPNKPG